MDRSIVAVLIVVAGLLTGVVVGSVLQYGVSTSDGGADGDAAVQDGLLIRYT